MTPNARLFAIAVSLYLLFGSLCMATPAQIQIDLKPYSQTVAALATAQLYHFSLQSSGAAKSLALELLTTPIKYVPTAAALPATTATLGATALSAEDIHNGGFVSFTKAGAVHTRCFSDDPHTVIGYWIDTAGPNPTLRFYTDLTGAQSDIVTNFDITCPILIHSLAAEDAPVVRLTYIDTADNTVAYSPIKRFTLMPFHSSANLLTDNASINVYQPPSTSDVTLNFIMNYEFATIGGQVFTSFATAFLDQNAAPIVGLLDSPGNLYECHDLATSQAVGRLTPSLSTPGTYLFTPAQAVFDFGSGHSIRCPIVVLRNVPTVAQLIRTTHVPGELHTAFSYQSTTPIPSTVYQTTFDVGLHGRRITATDYDLSLHGVSVEINSPSLANGATFFFSFDAASTGTGWVENHLNITVSGCGANFSALNNYANPNTFVVVYNGATTANPVRISCFFPVLSTYTGVLLDYLNPERPQLYGVVSAFKDTMTSTNYIPHRDTFSFYQPLFFAPPGVDYTLTRNDATWPLVLASTATPGAMKLQYEFTITKPVPVPDKNPAFQLQLDRDNALHLFSAQTYASLLTCSARGPDPVNFSPITVTFDPIYDRWQGELNTIANYATHTGNWVVRCVMDSYPVYTYSGKFWAETIPILKPTAFDWFILINTVEYSRTTMRVTHAPATFYNPPTTLAHFSAAGVSTLGTYVNTNTVPLVEFAMTVAVLNPTMLVDSQLSTYADGVMDAALMLKFASDRSKVNDVFTSRKTRSISISKAYSGDNVVFSDVKYPYKFMNQVQTYALPPNGPLKVHHQSPVDFSTDSRPLLVDVVVRYEAADTTASYTKLQRSNLIAGAGDQISQVVLNPSSTPLYSTFHVVSSSIAVINYGVGSAACGFPAGVINIGGATTVRKCQLNDACTWDADCPQTAFGVSVCYAGKCGFRNHTPFPYPSHAEPRYYGVKKTRLGPITMIDQSTAGAFSRALTTNPAFIYNYNDLTLTDRVLRFRFNLFKSSYGALYLNYYWKFTITVQPSPYSEHLAISFSPTLSVYLTSSVYYFWETVVRTPNFPGLIQHWFASNKAIARVDVKIYTDSTMTTLVAEDSNISEFFSVAPS